MTIHNCQQGTEEWLKIRLGKFGGTDAQAVANDGKGLETLCYQKVGEILTHRLKDQYTNEDLERGKELENTARLAYEMETGSTVEIVGYVELDEFTGVSPDGFVGTDGLVEIKCPTDANFVKFMYERKIDPKYVWQMQHQMFVTGRKWCDFVVFNDNLNKLIITRVPVDPTKQVQIQNGLSMGKAKIKEIIGKVNNVTALA